jgi:hypothetical protein
LKYQRMIMEAEAPDLIGYENFLYNLAESSVRDRSLGELGIDFGWSRPDDTRKGLESITDAIRECFGRSHALS